jgi:hypothetical protein
MRRHCRRKSARESADTEFFAVEGVRLPMLKRGGPVPIAPQIRRVILCKDYTKTRPVSNKVGNHDE